MRSPYAPVMKPLRPTRAIALATAVAGVAAACGRAEGPPSFLARSSLPTPVEAPITQQGSVDDAGNFLDWRPAPATYKSVVRGSWSDAACSRCHEEIAAEWNESMHRRSFENRYYQVSLASEDSAFCRSCHAPQARVDAKLGDPAAASGVGCVTCHVDPAEGRTIIGPRRLSDQEGVHDVAQSAALAGSDACRTCHEFQFPAQPDKMQRTHAEHEASAYAGSDCQSCHMRPIEKAGRSHTDHRFAVQTQPQMIRDAIVVESVRASGKKVEIDLSSRGAGHSVPTGDLHRTIELRARVGDSGDAASWARTHLKRSFTFRRHEQIEVSDTRLPALLADAATSERRTFVLELPRAPRRGQIVYWEISWLPADPEVARRLHMDPYAGELVLHSGTVPR